MKMLDNSASKQQKAFEMRMKVLILLAFSLGVIGVVSCAKSTSDAPEAVSARPVGEAIAEAEGFYAGRADLVKVRQGIVTLRQAQASDSANYDLAWRLAKFNYYLGAHSPDSGEQEKAFRAGIDAGKLAVKLQEGKPDGHFWLGANYGGSAKLSILSGLSEFNDIKDEMERVLKIDESYQSGSAYMALGQLYLQAPRILGGDTQKAIGYLEKGIKLGPTNALLRLRLAEAYVAAHRNDEAQKEIDALLAAKPAPGYEPEHSEAQAQARKLQEKLKSTP